jgi:hypothetical protein
MSSLSMGHAVRSEFFINQTDLLAPTSFEIVCPIDGFVNEIGAVVQTAVTTGGTLKVTATATDVVGAVLTVANGATKGTIPAKGVATAKHASRAVKKGDRIRVTPASFATAGAVNGYVEFVTGY